MQVFHCRLNNLCCVHIMWCVISSTQGSVLGPEEFFEGLGIGLKSFFAAGVVGK